ncbi:hypothetical protein H4R27_006112, partial [Coemansia aciculifera]
KVDDQAASRDNNLLPASETTSTTGQQPIALFARYLLRMAPSVTDIAVSIHSIAVAQSELLQLYSILISALSQGRVKTLHAYSVQGNIPISLNLLGVSGLTSITNGVNVACAPFARLIYLNSHTLRAINFRLAAENNWRNMIYGFAETPAVYSCLAALTLTIVGIPYDTVWAAIDDVAPFPILATLDISYRYPFDDDLLFRGNGKTMKNLSIPFRAIAKNILARFNVLKRSGVSRMNSVSIGALYDEDVAFVAERADEILGQQ